MGDLNDFPFDDLPDSEPDFKPWEQHPAPGMGSGGGDSFASPSADEPAPPTRLCQEMQADDLYETVDSQTDLAYYPMVARSTTPETNQQKSPLTNQQLWQLFIAEELYDTRRVTLKHFHLFEWFPLSPGRFHTQSAHSHRQTAYKMMFQAKNGHSYFNPWGKADMLKGGIGAVRLRPRQIAAEPHYFMTVSSNGVCHEGFPVLVPRRFYRPLKARILKDGAVAVNLSGEMRYINQDIPTFFESQRNIPLLYLHVDQMQVLPVPRSGIARFSVSVAISFIGQFEDREGVYATYATFDPAKRKSLLAAVQWLEKFYVTDHHQGVVITDFDEMQPRFPGAVFGLPELMAGKLDSAKIQTFLQSHGYSKTAGEPFFLVYKEINTQGGAYIAGDVNTGGGDFISRDKVVDHGAASE